MANKTKYTLEIDAEIGQLKSKLESVQTVLDKMGSSNFSNGFGKKISSILTQLERLQKKASQPIDSKATFASIEKGFGGIVADAKSLLSELEKISQMTTREKLSLLPEDEAKRLKSAISAVQAYTKAVEKAEKARIRSQEKRKGERETTAIQLEESKKIHKKASSDYRSATAQGTSYGDAMAIIAQAEAAKKAQKEIEQLEKQLKKYQKRLEQLNGIENRTEEQNAELQTVRHGISSVSGKIGVRKKTVKNAPDERVLAEATKTVEQQAPAIQALRQSAESAEKEVSRLESALIRLDEAIKNNSTEITASQADYKVLYEQAKKLGISLEGVTEDVNPTNIRILSERMRDLVEDGVRPLDTAIGQVTPGLVNLGDVARETGEKVAAAEEHFDSMLSGKDRINNLKENIRQFIGWAGASRVLSAAMRNAFENIKKLDEVMTEIAVVTDFNIGDMWDQMPTYTKRANELGLEITEVYEASALFYQQGLDTNEMVALSNETLKMAKIAGLDAAEATDRMTAALRGFNMELNEASASRVSDVYSKLAAITASDVDEISSAMTKTASIASSAGMEFETTAAFLSQIIETTRESAETAGTAMKTVIARFQELKKSPDEIGEIDGEIIDANAIEGALRSIGVSLRDASGQFRELDEVFLELSSKWDSLDKNTQRYIATIAAGSRQQSRFIAMMSNYARTQELVAAANSSAGASQKQYEKTLDSIQTKLKKLENAWVEFSTGLLNSELVKFAVDFLTSVLNALNNVTQGFEGFTNSLSKIGTMVAIFQTAKTVVNKFFDEVIERVYTSAVTAGQKIAQGTQDGINQNLQASNKNLFGWSRIIAASGEVQDSKRGLASAQLNVEEARRQKGKIDKIVTEKQAELDSFEGSPKKRIKLEKDLAKAQQQQEEIQQRLEERTKTLENAQINYTETSKKGFQAMCDGWAEVGQALTLVGVGIGMVGQMFSEAGFSEAGETISEIGKYITFIGSGITLVIPMIKLLGTTFKVEGGKIVATGMAASAAWWWVTAIIAGLLVAVLAVSQGLKTIQNQSAEKQLEKVQKSAEDAAQAADQMQTAYEDLRDSLEGIGDASEELKNLTYGTDAWRESVEKINAEILDLIQKYPRLASFINATNGVLGLDINGAGVQSVLNEYKEAAINAGIIATSAQMQVLQSRDQVTYESLNDDAKLYYEDPDKEASSSWHHTFWGTFLSGGGAGAAIGSAINVGIGTAIGTGIGLVAGGLGGWAAADFAAEVAAATAREENQKSQAQVEDIAKALANGDLVDTGTGYKYGENMTEEAFALKYFNLANEDLDEFYKKIGDSTDELKAFGISLNKTEKEVEGFYQSITTQIWHNIDKSGWNDQETAVGNAIVSSEQFGYFADKISSDLSDYDLLASVDDPSTSMTAELEARRAAAIQKAYGDGAMLRQGENGWEIVDGKGQVARGNVTSDDIKNIMASTEAKEHLENITQNVPQIASDILLGITNSGVGRQTEESKEEYDTRVKNTITKALSDPTGENLTQQEVALLNDIATTTDEAGKKFAASIFEGSEEIQEAFGTVENFVESFALPASTASTAFSQSQEFFTEKGLNTPNLTAGAMIGLSSADRIGSVYAKGTDEEVSAFQAAFNNIMGLENAQEIASYMNTIDWSNQEALYRMQYVLQEQYGVSAEMAQGLANSIINANDAVSNLSITSEAFGDFYQATQKINAAIQKATDLQWEYERMLNRGMDAVSLSTNLEAQRVSLLEQGQFALKAYEDAIALRSAKYAEGVDLINGVDLTKYVSFDANTGLYDVSQLQARINAMSEEDKAKATEWMNELVEADDLALKQNDIAKDAYESLEKLNEQAEQAYQTLYDQIGDLLVSEMEKAISVQEDILDATESANERLVDKIQEQIDDERQARENEKAEKNISDLRSQIAYLGMDSSGANQLQILELEKQVQEEEEAYQDELINQSIQQLEDANNKAAEQRERQISLQEQQLELYKNSTAYQGDIQKRLNEYLAEYRAAQESGISFDPKSTQLGIDLINAGFLEGMNHLEEQEFWKELVNNTSYSAKYADGTLKEDTKTYELLDGIMNNTSINSLTTALWSDRVASANQAEATFAKTVAAAAPNGVTSFAPDVTKSGTGDYKDESTGLLNSDAIASDTYKSQSIFTTDKANRLIESDKSARDKFDEFNTLRSNMGSFAGNTEPLSQEKFYDAINNKEEVSSLVGGKAYTHDRLVAGLEDGTLDGSYESYLNEYLNSKEYANTYSDTNKQERRKELEKDLSNKLVSWQEEPGFTGAQGTGSFRDRDEYQELLGTYQALGGKEQDFIQNGAKLMGDLSYGIVPGAYVKFNDWSDHVQITGLGDDGATQGQKVTLGGVPAQVATVLKDQSKGIPYMYNGDIYWRGDSEIVTYLGGADVYYSWYRLKNTEEDTGGGAKNTLTYFKNKLLEYKTGGLANFTGPAWLDGTPSRPEYILNADQTERFFSLIDVLENYDTNRESVSGGDNYFDINISVEKIEDDYDVEQMADKIRRMIYEDATYRNVNAINLIR